MTYYDYPNGVADHLQNLEMNCGVSGHKHQQRPLRGWRYEEEQAKGLGTSHQGPKASDIIQAVVARLVKFIQFAYGSQVKR